MEILILLLGLSVVAVLIYVTYALMAAMYHIYQANKNRIGKASLLLGPIDFFMPRFFNAIGNGHRVKALRLSLGFIIGFMYCFGMFSALQYFS